MISNAKKRKCKPTRFNGCYIVFSSNSKSGVQLQLTTELHENTSLFSLVALFETRMLVVWYSFFLTTFVFKCETVMREQKQEGGPRERDRLDDLTLLSLRPHFYTRVFEL